MDAETPRRARLAVTDLLAGGQTSVDLQETAALLVSELVTNALLHGSGSASMHCELTEGFLRVGVYDEGTGTPEVREPGHLASSGRGLLLVRELADEWGVQPDGHGGKVVWFALAR